MISPVSHDAVIFATPRYTPSYSTNHYGGGDIIITARGLTANQPIRIEPESGEKLAIRSPLILHKIPLIPFMIVHEHI